MSVEDKNMNNKTKTSMILTSTIVATIAMTMSLTPVYGIGHYYGGPTLPNGDADFYFHCSTLATMSV
ncbi:MAG: hypothetical protein J4F36_14355 [Nitrosopumilaceae archaeon]|nr:hypothetical protein [Nitrosopumilaceae archaeon]